MFNKRLFQLFLLTIPLMHVNAFTTPLSNHFQTVKIALCIGSNIGISHEKPLKYAIKDAKSMASLLRQSSTFDKERVYLLSNPSIQEVKETLKLIEGRIREMQKIGSQAVFLLYYSGHGSSNALHIGGEKFSKKDFQNFLAQIPSHLRLVILDACESGDFLRSKGGKLEKVNEIHQLDVLKVKGTIFLSASAKGQLAQESEEYRGGVFSHHLINGIKGLADSNDDGLITSMELFTYTRNAVQRETFQFSGISQDPTFDLDLVGTEDIVLANYKKSQANLILEDLSEGPLEIYELPSMRLKYKVWLNGARKIRFQVHSGRYLLVRKGPHRVITAKTHLNWVGATSVTIQDFKENRINKLTPKGISSFYRNSFGIETNINSLTGNENHWSYGIGMTIRNPEYRYLIGVDVANWDYLDTSNLFSLANWSWNFKVGLLFPIFQKYWGQISAGPQGNIIYHIQNINDLRFTEQQFKALDHGLKEISTRKYLYFSLAGLLNFEYFITGNLRTYLSTGPEAIYQITPGLEWQVYSQFGLGWEL